MAVGAGAGTSEAGMATSAALLVDSAPGAVAIGAFVAASQAIEHRTAAMTDAIFSILFIMWGKRKTNEQGCQMVKIALVDTYLPCSLPDITAGS